MVKVCAVAHSPLLRHDVDGSASSASGCATVSDTLGQAREVAQKTSQARISD